MIGAATACFLARDHGLAVHVLERDPSYRRASSALSASSLRQQFTTPLNILLSQASLAFLRRAGRVQAVIDDSGMRHAGDAFVLAAGAWTRPLAAQLGFELPVHARKRDVFVLSSPASLPGCPLLIDPSGVWLRPEGQAFLAGAPPRGVDADELPLDAIDHGLFDDLIWPTLAARIPAFEALRVQSAWAGYYVAGAAAQIDLSPLAPERILRGQPLLEDKVI